MVKRNLCKRCALSGTEACPPGWMRNSVSTSEGVVSCSGFEPKPMVPRRDDAKPNLQNISPPADPEFMTDLRNALGAGKPFVFSDKKRALYYQGASRRLRKERDQARTERDAVAAGVQDLHDRLIRAREATCRLRNELTTLKKKHTELCVKHANAGTIINAQEACAKRQDARILSLQNRVNFLEKSSYREAIEELGDLVFNGEPDYDPAEVVRAVRTVIDANAYLQREREALRACLFNQSTNPINLDEC